MTPVMGQTEAMSAEWSDSPIKSQAEDEFGRSAYAAHAAKLIVRTHSWSDSVVFSLTGPWGSGKSSMLAMITEELERTNDDWRVARFTPWATNDVNGLLGDFYASLTSAFPTRRAKRFRAALGTMVQVSAPAANMLPWGGSAVAAIADNAGAALKNQPPWDKAFQQAAAELKALATPVLLIVDDIDRLQTQELLALLKVIRLLGRFPGVHYLLAYDEATLFQALTEANLVVNDGGAGRFMEKIVQYPLVVPPLLPTQLLSRLEVGLNSALAQAGRSEVTTDRLRRLTEVYLSQLSTPRAIDRYLAQLRHHLPLIDESEVDDGDVILLTLLRTAFPTLYVQLPRWRNQLISGHTGKIQDVSPAIRYEPFDEQILLDSLPESAKRDAETLLFELFPKLHSPQTNSGPTNRRICNEYYFDRYFAMGIPSHDIADSEVALAVEQATHGNIGTLQSLLRRDSDETLLLVIDKAQNSTDAIERDTTGNKKRLLLLAAILPTLAQTPDNPAVFVSPRNRVLGWSASLLKSVTDSASPTDVTETLTNSPDLVTQLDVVYYLRTDEYPIWMEGVLLALRQSAGETFLTNLRLRDAAPEQDRPISLVYFLQDHYLAEDLTRGIAAGLEANDFRIEDLAARFVTRRMLTGEANGKWRLHEFAQDLFSKFAPAVTDPWYDSPTIEVDELDISWANRRAFAAGRAIQPPDVSNPERV